MASQPSPGAAVCSLDRSTVTGLDQSGGVDTTCDRSASRTGGGHSTASRAEGVTISTFAWIAVGVAAWLVVAALVGLLIGRMIRGRDRQVPRMLRSSPAPRASPRRAAAMPTACGAAAAPGRPEAGLAAHLSRPHADSRRSTTRPGRTRLRVSSGEHLRHGPRNASRSDGSWSVDARRQRAAAERAAEQDHLLSTLLAERDGLLAVLDRVLALQGTARLIRDAAGADAGFVADVDGGSQAVIRWLAGNRTDSLQDLVVPIGQGVGGRVMATGPAGPGQRLRHRAQHHPPVRRRGQPGGDVGDAGRADPGSSGARRADRPMVAVAYAALRGPGRVRRRRGARGAGRGRRRLAGAAAGRPAAAAGRDTAVAAERQRMQASLHDSVGAMLFSIGAQVRDLRIDAAGQPAAAQPARASWSRTSPRPRWPCARRCWRCPSPARSGRCRSSWPSTAAASPRAPGSRPGWCSWARCARWTPSAPRCWSARSGRGCSTSRSTPRPARSWSASARSTAACRSRWPTTARPAQTAAAPRVPGWASACWRSGPRGSAAGSAWCTTRTAAARCGCCCRARRPGRRRTR